ncbi:MAG: glycoside hydrolase family 3 C-terminal domain-containing protein [Acidimicrobiales bacterium]
MTTGTTTTASTGVEGLAVPAASDLTVDEQAMLTAGADMWHAASIGRLGVPSIALTDGPSGARGTQFTGASSTSMPCGTALASTWNRDLIEQVGRALGDEARAKGASVLLAPTVNIQRHPLGGRNFECYSEDPFLTAEIAVAFIGGVQSRGVACAVKHFVCNDQETDRMEIDVVVDERTRREIYLPPFEAAVRQAGVWSVMAAYNRIDGCHCSEHAGLLTDLLRREWGFDGVVVSDWFGTHSLSALTAGLDLEMPGPATFFGHHLLAALEAGEVTADAIEQAARRVLDLVERTGPSRAADPPDGRDDAAETARAAATEAIVLLTNDGVLPLTAAAPRVAVVGWRADEPEFQGGGSAQVVPPYVITPLQGIVDRAGESSVTYESGRSAPPFAPIGGRLLVPDDPAAAGGAVRLDYFAAGDLTGTPLRTDAVRETMAVWFGEPAPGVPEGDFSARLTATVAPPVSGPWALSVSAAGVARLFLDGELLADTTGAAPGPDFFGLFTVPVETEVAFTAGTTYQVVAEFDTAPAEGMIPLAGLTVAARPPAQPDALERAVQAAGEADVAVVVVGRDVRETEGQDATTMDLPDEQVALIRQVAAANARTIVAVNTASPVAMDWADDVAAVIQMSYLGQETGVALAAVLFGDADASGRLTATHPRTLEDSPAHASFPGQDGTVTYAEGVFVGYRHYDTHGVDPRWCFGHGLSYTTFSFSSLVVAGEGAGATVSVDVTNTGDRRGSEVVQVYVRPLNAPVARPDRELKGFEKVTLDSGETTTVTVALDQRAFAHWDTSTSSWCCAPGAYEILVGSSSRAIHQSATLSLEDDT